MRGKNVMVLAFFNLIDNKNNGDRQDKQRMGVRTAMGAFMDTKIEWRLSVSMAAYKSNSFRWSAQVTNGGIVFLWQVKVISLVSPKS